MTLYSHLEGSSTSVGRPGYCHSPVFAVMNVDVRQPVLLHVSSDGIHVCYFGSCTFYSHVHNDTFGVIKVDDTINRTRYQNHALRLCIISPSSAGMSQVLHECEKNWNYRHDLKYNAKKGAVMIYRSMTLKGCIIPKFKLNGIILHVVASYKYIGHYITDDLSDDEDINRQRRTLFVQGNYYTAKV